MTIPNLYLQFRSLCWIPDFYILFFYNSNWIPDVSNLRSKSNFWSFLQLCSSHSPMHLSKQQFHSSSCIGPKPWDHHWLFSHIPNPIFKKQNLGVPAHGTVGQGPNFRSSHQGTLETNPTRNMAATALIWPLAWEPPYAAGAALKRKKDKKKKKKEPNCSPLSHCGGVGSIPGPMQWVKGSTLATSTA